jgi:predicted RecB family endonuclease
MTELDAELLLATLLERDGWSVSRQVGLGQKHVDIVASSDETWAIEVKLGRWRRAAHQAFLNGPYFHRSYIALPRNPNRSLDTALFAELGIGVIEFDNTGFTCVIDAPRRLEPTMVVQPNA